MFRSSNAVTVGGELLEGCRGKGKGKGLKSEDSLLVKSLNCDLTPNSVKQGAGVGLEGKETSGLYVHRNH